MEDDSISWGELAELTHATQVERFGWCICEDPEQGQLAPDCPRAVEETHKECIECFRMFEKPEDDADVCQFCQESGREGRTLWLQN